MINECLLSAASAAENTHILRNTLLFLYFSTVNLFMPFVLEQLGATLHSSCIGTATICLFDFDV